MRDGYTIVPNAALRDKRLSLRDIGLLAFMASLPPDWEYSVTGLCAVLPIDGRDAIKKSLHRIEVAGFLSRETIRDSNGRFHESRWTLNLSPQTDLPSTGLPFTDKPATENPQQTNKDNKSVKKEQSKDSLSHKRFSPPTVEQVKEYAAEHGLTLDAEKFVAYYQANGWKVGKNPMKSWTAAARYWQRNSAKNSNTQTEYHFGGDYSL